MKGKGRDEGGREFEGMNGENAAEVDAVEVGGEGEPGRLPKSLLCSINQGLRAV